jgi:hypothetical protein
MLRNNSVVRQNSSFKRETFGLSDLDGFEILPERRKIRQEHVNKIYKSLCAGNPVAGALIVNLLKGKMRLVDGNHRFEAIRKYLTEFPDRKVEVYIVYFENLTEDEERLTYTIYNTVRSQTSDDFVRMYSKDIPILQQIENNMFSVKISLYGLVNGQRGMRFSPLMKSYLSAHKTSYPDYAAYSQGRMDFVVELKKLGTDDYNVLRDFCKFFEDTFGHACKENDFISTPLLNVVMALFYDNPHIPRARLSGHMKKRLMGNPVLINAGRLSGNAGTPSCYMLAKSALSVGKTGSQMRFRTV